MQSGWVWQFVTLAVVVLSLAGCDGRILPAATQAGPAQTAAGAGNDGSRHLADRPDDADQFQIHPFYVLPPGAKDFEFDRNGQLDALITRANTWFAAESGGARLRFDLAAGKPDITFLRLTGELPGGSGRMKALGQELKQAGFRNPRKYHLVFFGGANPDRGSRIGIGQAGLALVELDECKTGRCDFGKVERHSPEGTMLHEILHSLGAVPEGAPNYYDKTHGSQHTGDMASDIMNVNPDAAGSKDPVRLDPGRDDYYGHGRQDLLDIARSVFLDPQPANYVPPRQTRLAIGPGTNPVAYARGVPESGLIGSAAVEDEVVAAVTAKIAARSGATIRRISRVKAAVRLAARESAAKRNFDMYKLARQAGYVGTGYYSAHVISSSKSPSAAGTQVADAMPAYSLGAWQAEAGAYVDGSNTWVVVFYAMTQADFEESKLGLGPYNTYTLTARFTALTPDASGNLEVLAQTGKNQVYDEPLAASKVAEIYLDFPRDGAYKSQVFMRDAAGKGYFAGSFYVDGTKPLDQAALDQEPATVRVWPEVGWLTGGR